MSLEWVRTTYNVPAKRGMRVEYSGTHPPRMGTITGAQGSHVCIRLDGMKHSQPYHPTWMLKYLDGSALSPSGRGTEA